jgi:hypothetical protein
VASSLRCELRPDQQDVVVGVRGRHDLRHGRAERALWLVAAYIAAMAVISLIALSMLPDRTHADLTMEIEPRERRTGPRMEPTRAERPVTRS